jgi:hypothetical protein
MDPSTEKQDLQNREMNKYLFLVLCLLFVLLPVLTFGLSKWNFIQWDFPGYYFAAKLHANGDNPYDTELVSQRAGGGVYEYGYPPNSLFFFRTFTLFDFELGKALYFTLKVVLLFALIFLWGNVFLNRKVDFFFFPFCILAYNAAVMGDIASGNVSIIEQFFLWCGFYFFLERKIVIFSLFVVGAAAFKITPVLFILLLWYAERGRRSFYLSVAALAFLAYFFSPVIFSPETFQNHVENMGVVFSHSYDRGLNNPSTFAFVKDVLDMIEMQIDIQLAKWVDYGVFMLIAVAIIALSAKGLDILADSRNNMEGRIVMVFFTCLTYALISPRFKNYSYVLLIVPTYYLLKRIEYKRFYPYILILFCFVVPDMTKELSLFSLIGYYPLAMAYGVWTVYLYVILRKGDSEQTLWMPHA